MVKGNMFLKSEIEYRWNFGERYDKQQPEGDENALVLQKVY